MDRTLAEHVEKSDGMKTIKDKLCFLNKQFGKGKVNLDVALTDLSGKRLYISKAKIDNSKQIVIGCFEGFQGAKIGVSFDCIHDGDVILESTGNSGGGG